MIDTWEGKPNEISKPLSFDMIERFREIFDDCSRYPELPRWDGIEKGRERVA